MKCNKTQSKWCINKHGAPKIIDTFEMYQYPMVVRMMSGGWIISHRCSWITVYVLCCNAQVNLIVIFMTCTCIVLHSLLCQLPNYNLFTQHVIYLYGETPLVNYGPRSIILHILLSTTSTVYFPQALLYFIANKYHLPHDTFNPLFSANR
jgi:hypothetical protein